MSRSSRVAAAVVFALAAVSMSCTTTSRLNREVVRGEDHHLLDRRSAYLKAHMAGGQLYVLERWRVDEETQVVRGSGTFWDAERASARAGEHVVAIDSVAIFETNVIESSPSVAAMAVITGVSLAVTGICAANPKSCFGSCPTFYADTGRPAGSGIGAPLAEGFSASIAPSLEATDVDLLSGVLTGSRELERDPLPGSELFRIEMRNEALETHVVRHVDLLVAPRPRGGRVLQDVSGGFRAVRALTPPSRASAREGDCRKELARLDGTERVSDTDPEDLATRETIELEFDAVPDGPVGLVIGARQSLLSTFLFYQTLAFLGDEPGEWLARLERIRAGDATFPDGDGATLSDLGPWSVLGGIEVEQADQAGAWSVVGSTSETGPLATNVHLITLPSGGAEARRLRLSMARGHWRLDWVALAGLGESVEPLRIRPHAMSKDGRDRADALEALLDETDVLITFPGDEYTLSYLLPRSPGEAPEELEVFLESRGYYLEWIREPWLREGDPERLARLLFSPRQALRELAPDFKRLEPRMDELFWRSRYAKP